MLENNRPPIGVAQFNIGHLTPIDRDVLFGWFSICVGMSRSLYVLKSFTQPTYADNGPTDELFKIHIFEQKLKNSR